MKYPGNIVEILIIMVIILKRVSSLVDQHGLFKFVVKHEADLYIYIYQKQLQLCVWYRSITVIKKLQRLQPSVSLNMRSPDIVVKIFMWKDIS
jgi:hypothetical protein